MARPKKVVDELYHICVEMGREQYVGKGKDVYEAFADLEKPKKIYKPAVIVFRKGEKTVAKVVSMLILKRIFAHKPTQYSWLKLFENI